MMYPTLYSLLGLTALIPLAVSMPANPAGGGTNVLSLVTPAVNPLPPLPPPPPGWYPIPHTGLCMYILVAAFKSPPFNPQ